MNKLSKFVVMIPVLLLGIEVCLFLLVKERLEHGLFTLFDLFLKPIYLNAWAAIWILILFATAPMLSVSSKTFKDKLLLGLGLPALILVFAFTYAASCNSWFCGLIIIPFLYGAGIYTFSFIMGLVLDKAPRSILVIIIIAEIILAIIGIMYMNRGISDNIEANSQFIQFQTKLQNMDPNSLNPSEIADVCDQLPSGPYITLRSDCWREVMDAYPGQDVCAWTQDAGSKKNCMFYQELRLRNICEGEDHFANFKLKDDKANDEKLKQCWIETAAKYPEARICVFTYEWNREKCAAALNNN